MAGGCICRFAGLLSALTVVSLSQLVARFGPDRPKRRTGALRASVGSTEASNGRLARVGVVGPKRATRPPVLVWPVSRT
jgi:hypothetical protein